MKTQKMKFSSKVYSTSSGANRTKRKPPPLTIPACIMAETGVGEFNELVNHRWKGQSADWDIAVMMHKISAKNIRGECVPFCVIIDIDELSASRYINPSAMLKIIAPLNNVLKASFPEYAAAAHVCLCIINEIKSKLVTHHAIKNTIT